MIIVPALAQESNFPDVQESHWAYKDLARMKTEGLLVGYPDGLFRGGRPASRYELAVACHAVWSNLKGVIDGLNGQISDLNTKIGNAASKEDIATLQSQIDALKADLERIKNEDIAELRKMADEFRNELTKLGADVDAMKKDLDDLKGKVSWLWQHKLPFDISGQSDFLMIGGYSRDTLDGGYGITVDGRPEGVKRSGNTGPGGFPEDLTILHENALNLVTNNDSGPVLHATMVMGNMMGNDDLLSISRSAFGDQSQVYPGVGFSEAEEAWYFQDFNITFDTSLMGLGMNANLGRTGYKISPYIFQRPDTTPYFSNDRWDDGRWMFDGGILGFKVGGGKLDVFAGRNGSQTDTGYDTVQPMYAGAAGNPFSPGASVGRPRGFYRNQDAGSFGNYWPGVLWIDQSLGLNLNLPLTSNGNIDLAYLWLDSDYPVEIMNARRDANQVDVYGGTLAYKFGGIQIEGGYSKSDVLAGTHLVVKKYNDAWYATAGGGGANWGLKAGYRQINPQFGAPGDWGRIGIWWNPTDIKGWMADAHYDFNKDIRLSVNGGFYTGTGTVINGLEGLGTNDHLDTVSVGLGYKFSQIHT
ncbi:MAG TPA: S-layer homology domain-containing protein, partial [Fimbriimonadaceae bacterium]|nr:S-layer homology domain-containing protein [Fimbriimonadaceae bacterium]